MSNTIPVVILLFACTSLFGQKKDSLPTNAKITIKSQRTALDIYQDSLYQWRIKQTKLDNIYIPSDLNDCMKQLDILMEEDTKTTFKNFKEEEVDRKTHNTLGRWIDIKWKVSEGSRISYYFNLNGVPHPDYMIGIILISYHRHLHGKDLGYKDLVLQFREIWKKKQREKAESMINKSK